jgi:oligopeptide/dipeptide ABC transporter ATP-binding protein
MTSLVQVDGLSVSYAGRSAPAVRNVSLDVAEGDIHGLVGESGSGKSTIARALLGLTDRGGRVRAGTVSVAGSDLSRASARQLRRTRGSEVAYVGQNPFGALHPLLRIERQFELMRRAHPGTLNRAHGRARSAELLVQVGIHDPERVLRCYVHELSGGMAQRIVIAMAMFLEPRLIVADEPTTGLDVTLQRQILDLLVEQAREHGVGLLLITHDLGVVAQYCRTVTVLYAGQLMEAGPVETVLTRPRHPYTQALISAVPVRGQPLAAVSSSSHPVLDGGCPFRLRCPIARVECASAPPLVEIAPVWRVSCHAATGTE